MDGGSEESRLGRLVGGGDARRKFALAAAVLVIAVGGGLAGAVIGVSITSDGPSTPASTSSRSPGAAQATGHDNAGAAGSAPGSAPGNARGTGSGKVLVSATPVALADESSLTYDSASGPQQLLTYFGLLGQLSADNAVNLAILDPPTPATPGSAYAACQADGNFTSQITLNSLEQGSSICAFTPNHQVFWIEFRPSDPNAQSSALELTYTVWQEPGG